SDSFHGSGPTTPDGIPPGLGYIPVRSPLLRESRLISFPPGTEMFQFPGSPRAFRARRSLGSSPGHFAAFHARILMTPRHPPRALRSLTTPIGPPRPPSIPAKSRHLPQATSTERRALTFNGSRTASRGVSRRGDRFQTSHVVFRKGSLTRPRATHA